MTSDRRLIEEWLPIAEIGIESDRERGASSALPPLYYLHTWWARRPLVVSRAAVLASIMPAGSDRKKFIHALGIHGDPIKTHRLIDQAVRAGKRYEHGYGYDRAFKHVLDTSETKWINKTLDVSIRDLIILDPTAGGGSLPFEAMKIGSKVLANDLNPVAALIMLATLKWPILYKNNIKDEFAQLTSLFMKIMKERLESCFPYEQNGDAIPITLLWARTIPCPHCSGLVPLSPNWRIAPDGTGVRLQPHKSNGPGSKGRVCSFKIVKSVLEQSEGTVSGGDATCPYPDCRRAISGDEIKEAAKSGNMDEQLYAVAYKKRVPYLTKTGRRREKWIKEYRAPKPADDNSEFVQARLEEKLAEWDAYDIIPTERFPHGSDNRPIEYGMPLWRDLFSPRQLLCHGTGVEIFRELWHEGEKKGNLTNVRRAAFGYLAIALDSLVNYNSRLTTWHANRTRVGPTFARHDYGFSWSYVEMSPLVAGLGYEWAFKKTAKCINELLSLVGVAESSTLDQGGLTETQEPEITCRSGDSLDHIENDTVDVVVIDPPYYNNVMYAELSDFFYVWLKRTAGLVFPDMFQRGLTDKENEAVANPAKFAGQRRVGAMARQDYEERMALIFEECRRVLKPAGIMTVMFMHKSTGAWDALTKSIIKAGFYITTSWPINSEARGSLHIRDKAAAKSTILLACRPRQGCDTVSYWEDIEPKVREAVRGRIGEFERAGMRGVDVYLSAFGPALEEFSRNWPMKRSAARRDVNGDDPYSVTPEDALEAARREVKQWRLDKLICSTANKDLDPTTAFFILAWDSFESPKFPYDEALHLAKAVDVDLERDVIGRFAKKDGEYLVLWDSQRRKANGTRRTRDGTRGMIDELHHIAYLGRKSGAEEAIKYIESEHLDGDDSFMAALEAVLEVLPPSSNHTKIDLKGDVASASGDFDALFNIYRLRFSDKIDDPNQLKLYE